MSIFLQALEVASGAHKNQKRRDGLPFITHPMHVVSILIEHDVLDEEILSAAILHDVVEDCGVTLVQVEHHFGARVADLVAELTHKGGSKVESFKKMSPDARLIKMADMASDLSSMHRFEWSDLKRRSCLVEAIEMAQSPIGRGEKAFYLCGVASMLLEVADAAQCRVDSGFTMDPVTRRFSYDPPKIQLDRAESAAENPHP